MGENHSADQNNGRGIQAYVWPVICLLVGIVMGYFFRGSAPQAPVKDPSTAATRSAPQPGPAASGQTRVTPEQLKHMAQKKAEPLQARLQSDPNNPVLLAQIGNIYYDTQNYDEAIKYYDRSLKADPKNLDVRTDLGTSFFYLGNSERAIQEFHTVLKYDAKHAQTIFNMGMVQWQGKGDVKAALASWEQLLKVAPNYPDRAKVEKLIAQAKAHSNMAPGTKTEKPATM